MRQTDLVGWSIVSAVAIAAFWGIWYLVTGSVPAEPGWVLSQDYYLPGNLVPRWLDVLVGPFLLIAGNNLGIWKQLDNDDIQAGFVVGGVMGGAFTIGIYLGCSVFLLVPITALLGALVEATNKKTFQFKPGRPYGRAIGFTICWVVTPVLCGVLIGFLTAIIYTLWFKLVWLTIRN